MIKHARIGSFGVLVRGNNIKYTHEKIFERDSAHFWVKMSVRGGQKIRDVDVPTPLLLGEKPTSIEVEFTDGDTFRAELVEPQTWETYGSEKDFICFNQDGSIDVRLNGKSIYIDESKMVSESSVWHIDGCCDKFKKALRRIGCEPGKPAMPDLSTDIVGSIKHRFEHIPNCFGPEVSIWQLPKDYFRFLKIAHALDRLSTIVENSNVKALNIIIEGGMRLGFRQDMSVFDRDFFKIFFKEMPQVIILN